MLPRIVGAGLAAYLLGSIPPGIFWAWLIAHIDVRLLGSGRTGARMFGVRRVSPRRC